MLKPPKLGNKYFYIASSSAWSLFPLCYSPHYITIVNGGLSFLDAGFQLAKAIGDRKVNHACAICAVTTANNIALSGAVDIVMVFTEQIVGADAYRQSVFAEERTLQ